MPDGETEVNPPLRVLVVAEYYPSPTDPVLGIWAHRQALAVRDRGVSCRVLALRRPVPPERAIAPLLRGGSSSKPLRQWLSDARGGWGDHVLDGIPVRYVPLVAPPRRWSYGSWGLWAAPTIALAARRARRAFDFDLVHAHYAVPAGHAARLARLGAPTVLSIHGADVLATHSRGAYAGRAVADTLAEADLVLCNSADTLRRAREIAGPSMRGRVVHLGADVPALDPAIKEAAPTVVTVGHLVARKRHADVIRAVARVPGVRYLIVGDGPERAALHDLASELGLADRVEFAGQLDPDPAMARLARCHLFAMPSVDEAFGVAYVEAMAAGLPAVGLSGEGGPEEIAAAGEGMVLVDGDDRDALAETISRLLIRGPSERERLGAAARLTVKRNFTWRSCGEATRAAYDEALALAAGSPASGR